MAEQIVKNDIAFVLAEAHFSRNFVFEKKNDRLKTAESIRGRREGKKSINLAYDSVEIYRDSILWDEDEDVLEYPFVTTP